MFHFNNAIKNVKPQVGNVKVRIKWICWNEIKWRNYYFHL